MPHGRERTVVTADKRNELAVRQEVMKLLSTDELAEIDRTSGDPRLREGQQYLDLEQASEGVKWAAAASPPSGRVLRRDAVCAATWSEIVLVVSGSVV